MSDVNLHDVVEISYKLIVPTNLFLGYSILQVVFPPITNIRKGSFFLPCSSSQRINCFEMMLLPQVRSTLVTSRIWKRCTKERRLEYIEGFSNALDHLFVGLDVFST